jgi:CDP-diacylglycerol pyrophosphatase
VTLLLAVCENFVCSPTKEIAMHASPFHSVLAAAALLCAAAMPAMADPDALSKLVEGKCVPDQQANGKPAPCSAVDLDKHYAVLKDLAGASQYLLIPTDTVDGIESPAIEAASAPNYFEDAWEARRFMEKSLGRPVPRDVVGLAINSIKGRSQNQLHIHIDCVRTDVLATLAKDSPAIGAGWTVLPDPLVGHSYEAMHIAAADLSAVNPFALLADGQPAAKADMGDETLVAIAARLPDGTEGFDLLSDRVDLLHGNFGSGEELLDHDCAVLKEQ